MKVASFEAIVQALNDAGVRFIVVGGVAVNAHGYLRFTKDVDLVIQLSKRDIVGAFRALEEIDYRPSNPITAEQFADEETREEWRREKGMLVLKMWSDIHRETPLDIFVYVPFDFDAEYDRALVELGGIPARFASIETLIAMKEIVNRTQDRLDIEKLQKIAEIRRNESERNQAAGD
jgi:predicted nucleotidyltransferase